MNDLTIYDTFAESWWQAGSPLHLLARLNPARFAYFDPLVRHWAGLRVLDVGCGGGLAAACLVVALARLAFPPDTLHRHSLPGVCREASGTAAE